MTPKLDPDEPTTPPNIPAPPKPDTDPDIDLNKSFDADDPTDKENSNRLP
jgi:hypothetical protein